MTERMADTLLAELRMPLEFTILGSGSAGNSALVGAPGALGTLIDLGFGPRELEARLARANCAPESIGAAVLTHTHGDHIQSAGLRWLANRRIPLWCHESHAHVLEAAGSPGFSALREQGLIRHYQAGGLLALPTGCWMEPLTLSHDSGPTFGFRFEVKARRKERPVALGYVADTGTYHADVVAALRHVDLLGVEFNHDEELQKNSRRPYILVRRVLGDKGHLSNGQGADLLREVINDSRPGAVSHVVLLHLSRECNRPKLALDAARHVLSCTGRRAKITVAEQHEVSATLVVRPARIARRTGAGMSAYSGRTGLFPPEGSALEMQATSEDVVPF